MKIDKKKDGESKEKSVFEGSDSKKKGSGLTPEGMITVGGREISLVINKLAFQADSSITLSCGGTTLLVTVVSSGVKEELDYFPLQVEYVERLYAGGIIKGSRWVKREGRPSDEAILAGRLIDRAIRPLFPEGLKNEVQVAITVLSVDLENDPAILAALGVSAAIHLSSIPWNGPIGVLRVGCKDETFFVNPIEQEREFSDLDLILAVGKGGVVMIEAGANQIPDDKFLKGINFGVQEAEKIISFLDDLREKFGKEKMTFVSSSPSKELIEKVEKITGEKIKDLVDKICEKDSAKDNREIFGEINQITEEAKLALVDEARGSAIKEAINKLFKKSFRRAIVSGKRLSQRALDEIRPLSMEAGVLKRTHGSAIFQRGETQVLSVTTLGAPSLKQLIEGPEGEEVKRYIHHYFMPPYATGETGRFSGPGRREIGHGALAERALLPVVPSEEKFPYTIRIVSEVLSSNGSTSMASTCGSTLSLMDAGVPISQPVAGISIGLVQEEDKSILLTDIAGLEDFNGDMDFKVAGTRTGITAVQVDIKVNGLELSLIKDILERAKTAREKILDEMVKLISQPREKISQYAPKIVVLHINIEKIGELIGPGGRTIRKIIEETGCNIEVEDDGKVSISGISEEGVSLASKRVDALTRQVQIGETFDGIVKRIQPFGAFIEFLPGKEGLVHVSRLCSDFVRDPGDVVDLGQLVPVRVREIDEMGRVNLEPVTPLPLKPGVSKGERPQHFENRNPRPFPSKDGYAPRFGPPRRERRS